MRGLRKWGNLDLNQGPTGYESAALTAELLPLKRVSLRTFPILALRFLGIKPFPILPPMI